MSRRGAASGVLPRPFPIADAYSARFVLALPGASGGPVARLCGAGTPGYLFS